VKSLAEIDPLIQHDITQRTNTETAQNESDEDIFTPQEIKAAEKICRFWRKYWPRYKKAREWRSTPLGRSTTAIDDLCSQYKPELCECPEIVEDLYKVFRSHGPKTHEAITAAEAQSLETSERYQVFFTSLPGTEYTDEDLERVEELFEEFEDFAEKIAKMKATFTLDGMGVLWGKYSGYNQEAAVTALQGRFASMQRVAIGIKDGLVRLSSSSYVKGVKL